MVSCNELDEHWANLLSVLFNCKTTWPLSSADWELIFSRVRERIRTPVCNPAFLVLLQVNLRKITYTFKHSVAHISDLNMFLLLRWDKGLWKFEVLQNSNLWGNTRTAGIFLKPISALVKLSQSIFNIVQPAHFSRGIV